MHVSLNKCELIAEQIATNVPLRKVRSKIKDTEILYLLRMEYEYLQLFYDCVKKAAEENESCKEDAIFYARDFIAYILWYEINVKDSPSEAFEYAKRIVNRKWEERELEEDLAYV